MEETKTVTAGKPAKTKEPTCFGVYQLETGSYTLGEHRFRPFRPLGCPESVKDDACEETSPVKFYSTAEEANTAAAKLRARFEAKRNPKPQEEN
jgi:hypothetical protein